jgi:hypothetical protein
LGAAPVLGGVGACTVVPHIARGVLLLVAIVGCLAQVGDAALDPLRITIRVCQKKDRDVCGERTRIGYSPARIRLEVYFAPNPQNRSILYGLQCAGEEEPRALSGPYDLDPRNAFLTVEHPGIDPGECYGVAALQRSSGEILRALDGPVLIKGIELGSSRHPRIGMARSRRDVVQVDAEF